MSNINDMVINEGWGKKLLLAGGLAALGAGAAQTHTGKAIINKVQGNNVKAAWHGMQSPLLRNTTMKAIGKTAAKTAIAGGVAYGAKKAYDYSKTPEGQAKFNELKDKATNTYNNAKNTVTEKVNSLKDKFNNWFNKS